MESKKLIYSKANHASFEDLFENALIGLHIVGSDGVIRRANRADRSAVGLADEPYGYIGHHIGEFHAEAPVVEEILEYLLNNQSIVNYKADLKTAGGNRFPVSIYSNSKMDGGEFLNTRCFTKARVEELRDFAKDQLLKQKPASEIISGLSEPENQNRFDELNDFFDNGLVPVHMVDAVGIILWANKAELTAMGYENFPGEYLGQPIAKFHADQNVCEKMLSQLVANEPLIEFEAQLVRRDGSLFPVSICSNARLEGEKFINTRCFTYSVSDTMKEQPQRFTWPRNEKMF